MADEARKFIHRAPRYVLRTEDNQFLRFAPESETEKVYTTTFLNLSATGVAFVTHSDLAPSIGDNIKLEIPVPGADQMAWWGRVVRTEIYRPKKTWTTKDDFEIEDEVLVAVQFESLPEGHQKQIVEGLHQKANELARQNRIQFNKELMEFLYENYWKVGLFVVCALLTASILFFFSRPTDNYDAERGSPWGRRF